MVKTVKPKASATPSQPANPNTRHPGGIDRAAAPAKNQPERTNAFGHKFLQHHLSPNVMLTHM
tara:strand:+ start:82436 stop:82624 length:189 start_codon:yes stop_codon:yes gene_type:complete